TICHKCLEKDAARRYASAEALAQDLARFLEGKPIMARPASAPERLLRWYRREPAVAGLATATLLALLVGLGVSTFLFLREKSALEKAVVAERRANEQAEIA